NGSPAPSASRTPRPACLRRPGPPAPAAGAAERPVGGVVELRGTPPSPLLRASNVMGHRRSIKGSRLLITGASQGIGRALAVAAAARGGKVLAAARSADLLAELAAVAKAAG